MEYVLNITKWSDEEINQFRLALNSGKKSPTKPFTLKQGKSIGAIHVIKKLAEELKISDALNHNSYALLLIMARIIFPGSRRSIHTWAEGEEIEHVLGIDKISNKRLYKTLDYFGSLPKSNF